MTAKIDYDVYRGTADRTLRLATMPGAGLPAHLKRKDWVLMPKGKSPVHSDAERDVAVQAIAFSKSFTINNAMKKAKRKISPRSASAVDRYRRSDARAKARAQNEPSAAGQVSHSSKFRNMNVVKTASARRAFSRYASLECRSVSSHGISRGHQPR